MTELPGIGKTLEEKLLALDEIGDIPAAQKLRAKIPVGLVSVMHLLGFGAKRGEAALRRAGGRLARCPAGRARAAGSAGCAGSARRWRRASAGPRRPRRAGRRRGSCSRALPVADQVVGALRAHPAADRVEVAGSLRRLADSVKDIDVIATASDPAALAGTLSELPIVEAVQNAGDAGARVSTHSGMKIDLKVVEPDQFGNVLQHFTGPRRTTWRCARQRSGAACTSRVRDPRRRDRRDPALLDRGGGLRGARPAVDPPELREGRGELEAATAAGCPSLVELADLRGAALPHDDVRRAPDGRGDGARRPRARDGVPGHHRPLGLAWLRRPRDARRTARPDRGDPLPQRAAGRDRAADRDGVEHPP